MQIVLSKYDVNFSWINLNKLIDGTKESLNSNTVMDTSVLDGNGIKRKLSILSHW